MDEFLLGENEIRMKKETRLGEIWADNSAAVLWSWADELNGMNRNNNLRWKEKKPLIIFC
jgi:hypothetical protein